MWRSCYFGIALFACTGASLRAQLWQDTGLPTEVVDWGNFLLDTNSNTLYVSGINQVFPGETGVFLNDGSGWDTLGYFGNVVFTMILYHDTLIVGGGFESVNGDAIANLAYFNGTTWNSYGAFDQGVRKLRVIDGELYALGVFSLVDGQPADGIAKRVGDHWVPVGDFGDVSEPDLFDVIKYQGDLIACGNMSITGETYRDVYIYQDGEWGPLGGGLFGTVSGGWVMTIYHDELILGGNFFISAGNAGQCIMRWNGAIWQPLGVGTTDNSDSYSSSYNIHALCVRDDKLFVGGGFSYAGHVPAQGIATWDGVQWCGLGSQLGLVHDIVFYNDTLYAMVSNNWIDGEHNNGCVRYLGATYADTCSLPTSVAPTPTIPHAASVVYSDGAWQVQGLPDGPADFTLLDATGRVLAAGTLRSSGARSQALPFKASAPGVHVLLLHDGTVLRFVAE